MDAETTHDRPRLILASGSPQRRLLLADTGYAFEVVLPGPHAECGICSKETPPELVARLARQKAADVAATLPPDQAAGAIIVACDTVAECAGQILGKPKNRAHAREMLELQSGRQQHVYSGLCLWPTDGRRPQVRVERTKLRMDPLGEQQVEEYLESQLWEGKAGAFGYQDRAGWVHVVEGSESNVIGLPMELLADMLAEVSEGPQQPDVVS